MIELNNVNFTYKGTDEAGLRDITLTIPDGEALLLCGESGCGKTTLTRLINGLISHYYKGDLSGTVSVNGRNISETQLYDLAGTVGTVFQNPRSQFFSIDTDGEIVFGPENIGMSPADILKRKEQVSDDMELSPLLGRSLFELSGGEKQKIACASVSALMPDIMILRDMYFSYRQSRKSRSDKTDSDECRTLSIPELALPNVSVIALTGKNGAGKSTFLRCLCGLEKRCKVKLKIDGEEYSRKKLLKKCYMVMQDVNHQLFTDSVTADVCLSMKD